MNTPSRMNIEIHIFCDLVLDYCNDFYEVITLYSYFFILNHFYNIA